MKKQKLYTQKQVDKLIDKTIESCLSAKLQLEDFKKTGIPKCSICGKAFIKLSAYIWKPDCSCFKKDLRLGIG